MNDCCFMNPCLSQKNFILQGLPEIFVGVEPSNPGLGYHVNVQTLNECMEEFMRKIDLLIIRNKDIC